MSHRAVLLDLQQYLRGKEAEGEAIFLEVPARVLSELGVPPGLTYRGGIWHVM